MRRISLLALIVLAGCLDTMPPIPGVTSVLAGSPPGWSASTGGGQYAVGLTDEYRTGATSLYLRGELVTTQFSAVAQSIRAEGYRGKRVRWSA